MTSPKFPIPVSIKHVGDNETEGDAVLLVGALVKTFEGISDGLGSAVGRLDDSEGNKDGLPVGACGCLVGSFEGALEGSCDGLPDGVLVGV